jgi:hypothetical protein
LIADIARIVVCIHEVFPAPRILTRIGKPAEPPPFSPTQGPPMWDDEQVSLPDWETIAQPELEYAFDQRVGC